MGLLSTDHPATLFKYFYLKLTLENENRKNVVKQVGNLIHQKLKAV